MVMQRIIAYPRLIHKVMVSTLILSFDSAGGKQVLAKFEMLGILGNGVQTENGEFELGMARIPMKLTFVGSYVSHKAFDVLPYDICNELTKQSSDKERVR